MSSSTRSKSALIFLHGSGGTGHDMRAYVDHASLKEFGYNSVSDVCKTFSMDIFTPTSDIRRFTAMNGEKLNIWFDRTSLFFTPDGLDDMEDKDGIELSLTKITNVIRDIESRFDHIFIGGHSMGGVIALHTIRKNISPKLRGIFSIGSCLNNMSEVFLDPFLGSASKLPVLMLHGEMDDIVRCSWGRKTASTLLVLNIDVQFRSYPQAAHGLEEEEMVDVIRWMQDIIYTTELEQRSKCDTESEAKKSSTENGSSSSNSQSSAKSSGKKKSAMTDADSKHGDDVNDDEEVDAKHSSGGGGVDSTVEAVERLMRKQQLESEAKSHSSSGSTSSINNSNSSNAKSSDEEHCDIPYTIEYLVNSAEVSRYASPKSVIHYTVPKEFVVTMCARPVLACGSMFEIFPDPPNGVMTTITSSDPVKTAVAIGRRLQIRATSGSGTLNPCQMS